MRNRYEKDDNNKRHPIPEVYLHDMTVGLLLTRAMDLDSFVSNNYETLERELLRMRKQYLKNNRIADDPHKYYEWRETKMKRQIHSLGECIRTATRQRNGRDPKPTGLGHITLY